MTDVAAQDRRDRDGRSTSLRPGLVVLGVLLVLIGVGWLLDVVGLTDLRWAAVLPAALVLVGVAVVATARRGGSGGLVTVGIVLSVLVIGGMFVPAAAVVGGVGERTERPTTAAEVPASYDLSLGSMTIDLREIDPGDGEVPVRARVGIGELVLRLPEDASARVRGRTGIGEVEVLGDSRGGFGSSVDRLIDGTGEATFELDVSVGIGRVEVEQ